MLNTRSSSTLVRDSITRPGESLNPRQSGKVLPDSKTVESCAIKEKDFLVLMVAKVRLFSP